MPGIFVCIGRKGDHTIEEIATEIENSMKHENLYTSKIIVNSCALGVVERNLQHKSNLVFDKEKSIVCALRGNIYNKEDLSKQLGIATTYLDFNDAQFIIELFALKGQIFANYLNGEFNILIYDKKADKLIIVNDRYGTYPLFYLSNEKMVIFASEAKAVLKGAKTPPLINKEAIPEFFTFSFLLGDKTFFYSVKYLQPATILEYERSTNSLKQKRYWDFSKKAARTFTVQTYESHLKTFKKLAKKAVERRVQDKEKIGVFLSGGLDSRIIAAFASQTGKEVVTFTFGTKGCIQKRIGEKISQKLGVKNIFYEIPSNFIANYAEHIVFRGDGLVRIRDCHFISALEKVRKEVDTILMGIYGILFGWQRWEHPKSFLSKDCKLDNAELVNYLMRRYNTVLPLQDYQEAFTKDFYEEIKDVVQKNFIKTVDPKDFDCTMDIISYWVLRNSEPRYIFQNLQYIDWYLEVRHPFLDNDLVDFFAFALPPELKASKVFLRKAANYCFPSLFDIPIEHGGALPDASLMRFLMGEFMISLKKKCMRTFEQLSHNKISSFFEIDDYRRYDYWLRTGSRDYVLKILLDSRALNRGYFKSDYIKRIVKEHMMGKRNHEQLICDLINLELLFKTFFEANQAI
ncbi:MAG: asparagine synthase-related protein [Candidatus Bathyarchaeia archaeon]